MISVKLATLDLLKIKILWNKGYNITVSICDVTRNSLSCDSNYTVNMVLWPKQTFMDLIKKIVLGAAFTSFFTNSFKPFKTF